MLQVKELILSCGDETLVKVCRLVKFMIDHCQEILEQEPSSLFGGPPQRPDTAEVETGTFSESAHNSF